MKRWLLLPLAMFCCLPAWAELPANATLDGLLEQVRDTRLMQRQRHIEREARFLQRREERQEILESTLQALQAAKQKRQQQDAQFAENQRLLQQRRELLEQASAELGELFGSVRQAASQSRERFADSLINIERPGDLQQLKSLAESRELPSIDKLQSFWQLLFERTLAAGKVVRLQSQVIGADGREREQSVTRIGPFSAVSDGRYLRYLPQSGRLVELGRQPDHRYQLVARRFEAAGEAGGMMAIDPSRGAILAQLVQTPTLEERIRQGGVIGYLIIALGVVGLLVVIERLAVLGLLGRRMKRQLRLEAPGGNNPLGRVRQAVSGEAEVDAETLQLRLDEAILKEIPRLRRGLPLVGILAAVAPLLGLLGTVTGMIETFQSITLFGAGDPRLMSGGISQALVTTELGLAAAIPLVLLHSFISGRSNRLIQILDEQSAAMVAERAESRHGPAV
ncbi:MotA/TolQ/ExbB proton channel family protein [endosymbiont of Ridgeia piscesae]|jgi:biopolymer transport protein ExbB|uniref:Outer membrane transport energization protein ExbB n=1 Tax=endosymbiont of Ridgeia piscesae TaxID=54398 RepID=A0A0T5ZB62_9GAMM|nr:MotA/TolQ/ExbB proton channel family protein [endosymbiont of Ridgeia piscesae]KRT55745.1 outer membrane transport energization protein ExbB [endosymbiont of Ridgeia piscesae]KRT59726.1 outer membrane transport energization protein ExbB [endosymbiont of Ridgeia piscesae]